MSMPIDLVKVAITTDSDGNWTDTMAVPKGRLLQYRLDYGDTATGANLDIVGATTGWVYVNHDSLGTADLQRSPRVDTYDEAGAAALYASGGIPVYDYAYIGGEDLTITISSGGDTKSSVLYLWIG